MLVVIHSLLVVEGGESGVHRRFHGTHGLICHAQMPLNDIFLVSLWSSRKVWISTIRHHILAHAPYFLPSWGLGRRFDCPAGEGRRAFHREESSCISPDLLLALRCFSDFVEHNDYFSLIGMLDKALLFWKQPLARLHISSCALHHFSLLTFLFLEVKMACLFLSSEWLVLPLLWGARSELSEHLFNFEIQILAILCIHDV